MRKRSVCLLWLFEFAFAAGSIRGADIRESGDVQLVAHTQTGRSEFHIGELITLELSYSLRSESSQRYQITNAGYDRSGRLGIERFEVEPGVGWDDPLKLYFQQSGFFGGGLSSSRQLSAKPTLIYRDLNEWVRFNKPGQYRVVVVSFRVTRAGSGIQSPHFEVRSNELLLTIVPRLLNGSGKHLTGRSMN